MDDAVPDAGKPRLAAGVAVKPFAYRRDRPVMALGRDGPTGQHVASGVRDLQTRRGPDFLDLSVEGSGKRSAGRGLEHGELDAG